MLFSITQVHVFSFEMKTFAQLLGSVSQSVMQSVDEFVPREINMKLCMQDVNYVSFQHCFVAFGVAEFTIDKRQTSPERAERAIAIT